MSARSVVIKPLSVAERTLKDQCEEAIRSGLQSFFEVGQAMLTMKEERLYREQYATFEDYCAGAWQIDRSRGYQLMNAALIVSTMVDSGLPAPENERQARELLAVPDDQREDTWRAALDATGGKPTAAAVKAAAERLTQDSRPAASDAEVSNLDTSTRQDGAPADPPSRSDISEGNGPQVAADPDQPGHEPDEAAEDASPPRAEPQPPTGQAGGSGTPVEGGRPKPSTGTKKQKLDDPDDAEARAVGASQQTAAALVTLWANWETDPVRWVEETWRPDAYQLRDLPKVRDVFTPSGLRAIAKSLDILADELDKKGTTL